MQAQNFMRVYASGGSGSGAGHLQVPRIQGNPQAQRRTPGQGLSDHRRASQPKLFHGEVLLQQDGKVQWYEVK